MKPVRRALCRALLPLVLSLPAAVGCGSGTTPVGSPSGPPTTNTPTAAATSGPNEVTYANAQGERRYVVALDVDAR
jgi:hypothetical protein